MQKKPESIYMRRLKDADKGGTMEPIWLEIDCAALRHNLREVRRKVGNNVRILAVVKADAYSHGAPQAAHEFLAAGADCFGVARFSEAVILRQSGITAPILIFGASEPSNAAKLAARHITQVVPTLEYAAALNSSAQTANCIVDVHFKYDTGMGRLGFVSPDNGGASLVKVMRQILGFTNLRVTGMFTHFASSDAADLTQAHIQLQRFKDGVDALRAAYPELMSRITIHAANSAASVVMPEAYFSQVRPGIILYGMRPSDEMDMGDFELHPAMSLKGHIMSVKDVPADYSVSYGHTYHTSKATRLAVVPIGYADGYPRMLSNVGQMLVHGKRANIVGRVCMDQLMLDVGHIEDVRLGDEVVLMGSQGDDRISAEEIAAWTQTINYEVPCRFTARVPRIYVNSLSE